MEQRRQNLQRYYASDDDVKPSEQTLKKQREYALSSAGLTYRAHAYHVFTDPEFESDVADLRSKIERLYYPNISLETSYYDRHILQADRLPIKEVADRYRITLEDFGFYADGYFHEGYTGFGTDIYLEGGFKTIEAAESEYMSVYVIGKYTTLEAIRHDWEYAKFSSAVKQLRLEEVASRKRSPNYPELVYAVFKARMQKQTFKTIFTLYENGELPLFHGSGKQFTNEDSLERYYRKYAPKTFENDIDTARCLTYMHELLDDVV